MATNTKLVQTPAVALYTGISAAATSMRVTPYPVDLDGVKLTITDFGTNPTCTVDPKVSGFEEIIRFTAITDNGDNTATLTISGRDMQSKYPYTGTGTGKAHGSGAIVVFSDNPQVYSRFAAKDNDEVITATWTFNNFPITPATPLATVATYGFVRLSVAPVSPSDPVAVGANDTTIFAPLSSAIPVGAEMPFAGITIPSGWLAEDGSAVSRATYAALFAALSKSQTFTVTIASPAVVTATAHGRSVGDRIRLTTTGGFPTGLNVATDYYIISAGFGTNAFEVSTSPGGSAVNTTGSQNGTHTLTYAPHGHGDSSTTFNVPDRRGRAIIGVGTGNKTITILSVSGNVFTGNQSVAANNEIQTGAVIVFTAGTAGNLVNGNTYYAIRTGNNTFSVATSLANAQNGTVITLLGTETGSFALTLGTRTLGDTGGEEAHAMSLTELISHNHTFPNSGSGGDSVTSAATISGSDARGMSLTGGNAAMNVTSPFGVSQYIIKT